MIGKRHWNPKSRSRARRSVYWGGSREVFQGYILESLPRCLDFCYPRRSRIERGRLLPDFGRKGSFQTDPDLRIWPLFPERDTHHPFLPDRLGQALPADPLHRWPWEDLPASPCIVLMKTSAQVEADVLIQVKDDLSPDIFCPQEIHFPGSHRYPDNSR